MSTRLTLRDNLRDELKIDPSGKIWSDSILNRNLETAKRKVQQEGDYQWFFNDAKHSDTTVASTAEYALPSDFVRIEGETVKYNGIKVLPTPLQDLERQYTTLTAEGTPSVYYLRGLNIGFYQIPNAAQTFTFLYRQKLDDYSADASDSGMPSDFDEAMVQYAAYLCWNDIQGRSDKAVEAVQNFKEAMEGLNAQYLGRRDENNFFFGYETTQSNTEIPYYM